MNTVEIEEERWEDLKGYEGFYQISTHGNIKTLERICLGKAGKPRKIKERLLKLFTIKGYYYITLNKNGAMDQFRVNVLVGKTFVPNPDNLPILNHEDFNKLNNYYKNLKWCNNSYNALHAVENGAKMGKKGELHHNSILTKIQVEEIKEKLKTQNARSLSKEYKISEAMISNIKHNKNWIL